MRCLQCWIFRTAEGWRVCCANVLPHPQAVEGVRERADALEEANRVKSSFVANMSYELRTPLTSISGFAEMLQQGFGGQLEEQGRAYVAAILDSTERLSGLVDKVLDLTQSDAGQLPLERKPVDIAAMLEEAARDHRPSATAKAIDFAIEIDQTVGMANGDARRLRQVFDHLLENSFAYTPEGGRILIHAEGNKERAVVIVSDNGPGMNMAEQTAALDRFGRVAEGRSSEPALGLGLPLAKQFVEAHGGTLTLVSEPGQGTLVRIELPR